MINLPSIQSVGATGATGTSSGLDAITLMQILLVQDYDEQLQSMSKSIKEITSLKRGYREEIQELQKLLTYPTRKGKVTIPLKEFEEAQKIHSLSLDSQGNVVKTISDEFGPLKADSFKTNKNQEKTGAIISTRKIESIIENINQKITTLNEQSEISTLGLQSLTNQRKIALEAVSNIIHKEDAAFSTIIRNMA